MIVVKVELWSAITGRKTELARMEIVNDGELSVQNRSRGDYAVRALKGRSTEDLDKRVVQRESKVLNYPRLAVHVWNLVRRALDSMGYDK